MFVLSFRKEISYIRQRLLDIRTLIGSNYHEYNGSRDFLHQSALFEDQIHVVNAKINKLNIQVPALHMQMMPYTLKRLRKQCLAEYDRLVKEGVIVEKTSLKHLPHRDVTPDCNQNEVSDFLKNLKQFFKERFSRS